MLNISIECKYYRFDPWYSDELKRLIFWEVFLVEMLLNLNEGISDLNKNPEQ